ncbi:MAG TPA: ketol-acid reductoisomerase [Planctomycetia bacterium]|nr:ketol-acid reductoisomerase [Planctomycetia bacterium]
MVRIYRESDVTPLVRERLAKMRVAVIGFGNQGRAQALNLRDSGARVLIGNIADDYFERAKEDGFETKPIAEAVKGADVVMLLLPDEPAPEVFKREVEPNLKPGAAIAFASGYNVTFDRIKAPAAHDCLLLAPRMIGRGVRELYLSGEGFHSLVAVHHDATGHAQETLLALSLGVGTLKRGAVEVDFRTETELDLFNEQAFGPAFGHVLLAAIKTLIDAGYPKEAVFLELYLSGEFSYICKDMAETGLVKQLDHHSPTSQYGAISRGIRFLPLKAKRPMKAILENIRSGKFAREWKWEQKLGRFRFKLLRFFAVRQPFVKLERAVRVKLGLQP